MTEKCWECGEFKPEEEMAGDYDGMYVCRQCWKESKNVGKTYNPLDLEGARDRVIEAARELEEPFDRGDDVDVGRLMDALMWLNTVERNIVLAS